MPQADRWAARSRDARNWLAHGGLDGKKQPTPVEMVTLIEISAAITVLRTLWEIGVPLRRLEQAMERHPLFGWIVSEGPRHHPTLFERNTDGGRTSAEGA